MGDDLRIARVYTHGAVAVWLFMAAARSSVLVAKIVALMSLLIGLFVAFCLFIALALGVSDSGSLSGSLLYFVCTLLLAWGICRAKPVTVELAGKDAAAATFMFIVLMVVIVFVSTVAVVALVSEAFDYRYVIYGIVTLLLARGVYRAKSAASLSVMVLLAALAFITLTVGMFYSSYDGAPRSDGRARSLPTRMSATRLPGRWPKRRLA
jgi:hypothetical protein